MQRQSPKPQSAVLRLPPTIGKSFKPTASPLRNTRNGDATWWHKTVTKKRWDNTKTIHAATLTWLNQTENAMPLPPPTNSSTSPTPFPLLISTGMLAVMLASLSMLGPFAVDTYLPAFPNIQASLHASELQVQQTLTAYMLAFSVMTLWHGAISDSFGRRNIILASLAIFGIASLGCAAAHSIEYLWAFRILQGVSSGAGTVIGRAIIRDLFDGPAATRLMSLTTMIFTLAPAIAPIFGGWMVKLLDWRAIFLFMFGGTVVVLWCAYKYLPESLPPEKRQPFNPRALFDGYRRVFKSPLFHLKTFVVAFNFSGMFLYVAASPAFVTRHLGLGPDQFGWQFVPSVGGIFCGAFTANRLAGKLAIPTQVLIGYAFLIGSCIANVAYHSVYPPALPWSVIPLFFYTFGMAIVAPGVILMGLDLFPTIRGTASSCQTFALTLLASIVGGLLAPMLSGSVFKLAIGQLGLGLIGLTAWLLSRAYHDKLTRPDGRALL
jgi:DHA1 family bicyclomycin/chloramphenicol resistance-like MFS transporter